MSRLRDAWDGLLGRSQGRRKYQTRIAQIEAEWLDLLVSISDTLEKLNAWHQRIVQRDKRARRAESALGGDGDETNGATPPAPVTAADRKTALRQRVAAAERQR